MSLGPTLRDARQARGWTRRQLADAVAPYLGRPLTAQFLADLEADRRTAAPATLAALAQALDLDPAWLHWQAGALPRALLESPGHPVATPEALAAARSAFQAAAGSPDPGGPLPHTREVLAALRAHPTASAFTRWLDTHGYSACLPVTVPILVPLADGLLGVDAIPCRDGLVLAGYDALDPDAGYEQYRPEAAAALPAAWLPVHTAFVGLSRTLAAACAQALAAALGPLADPEGGAACSTATPSTTP